MKKTAWAVYFLIGWLATGPAAAQPGLAPGIDAFGDPLPPGAVTRIGTIRFRHSDTVQSLAYSPDGKRITSVTANAIAVWEADTGRRLSFVSFPSQWNSAVSLDGTHVAHRLNSGGVCVREAAGGEVRCTLPSKGIVLGLAFSKDGRRLASADHDGSVFLWDTANGKLVRRWRVRPPPEPQGLQNFGQPIPFSGPQAFTPDGKTLVHVGQTREGGIIVAWDVDSGKELVRKEKLRPQHIGLAVSPDGQIFATSLGSRINLWQLKTGQFLRKIPVADVYGEGASSLTFTPDGKQLVWRTNKEFCFWDLAKETISRRLSAPEASFSGRLAFSPDGKNFACTSNDHVVHFWDLATGKEKFPAAKGLGGFASVRFRADGKALLCSGGGINAMHDLQGNLLRELVYPADTWRYDISADGRTIAVADVNQSVRLYDEPSGKNLLRLEKLPWQIDGLNFSQDGKFLLIQEVRPGISSNLMGLQIWKRTSKSNLEKINQLKLNGNGSFFCAPGSQWIGVRSNGWDFHNLQTGRYFRRFHDLKGTPSAASPSGRTLVFTPPDESPVFLWELATAKPIRKLEWNRKGLPYGRFAFSPDGKNVAAGVGGAILLWDVFSGKQIGKLEGHNCGIQSLAFSPDGRYLLSAGSDTAILLWDCDKLKPRAPTRTDFTPDILKTLWDDLEAADPERGYQAVSLLIAAPTQAVPFLKKKMKPATVADQRVIQALIDDLDNEDFQVRSRAGAELGKLGELAEPLLLQTLTRPVSLECQRRVKGILDKMPFEPAPPAWLRTLRALEALEMIGTADAQKLVEDLSKGFAESRQTQEARLTLERMKKRGLQP